jgi:hypothetical protein
MLWLRVSYITFVCLLPGGIWKQENTLLRTVGCKSSVPWEPLPPHLPRPLGLASLGSSYEPSSAGSLREVGCKSSVPGGLPRGLRRSGIRMNDFNWLASRSEMQSSVPRALPPQSPRARFVRAFYNLERKPCEGGICLFLPASDGGRIPRERRHCRERILWRSSEKRALGGLGDPPRKARSSMRTKHPE